MRIPSGITDQVIYFVALDATDLKTRETGLSSFTVYRSRNGAAAAAFTTPTVTEVDSTNMPGVYKLLLDEDMTIASGNDSEEMVFHITHAGMAPVTRAIELYRRTASDGETLTVASGLVTLADGSITAAKIAADAITAAKVASDVSDEIADKVLTRPIDTPEASATSKCLLWLLAMALNKSDVDSTNAGAVTVFKTDGTTQLFTQGVTQTPIDPIQSKLEAS